MQDRIDKDIEKVKVTLHLPIELAKYLRVVSADRNITQSKYVADLIEAAGVVESLDMDGLRATLLDFAFRDSDNKEQIEMISNESLESVVSTILAIFGIKQV